MDYSKFKNCLRFVLSPDDMIEERTELLIRDCKKNGFDNVVLLFNAVEHNRGHITIEEAKPIIEQLKVASEKIRAAGLSVSLNNWIEMGHNDRGVPPKPNQDFTYMTDRFGTVNNFVTCPLCENWREYHLELVRYLVDAIRPDTYWIEDDFRYHNHSPLDWGGCFCPLHMAEYNRRLGTNYTREEFCERAFAKGGMTPERKVWLDVSHDSLLELAEKLTEAVRSVDPDCDIGLMTSAPFEHCVEAREWKKLLSTFAGDKHKINRIHLPAYTEVTGKDFANNFNNYSMAVRALCDDDTVVLPETENMDPNFHCKSPKFFKFVQEAALPLCLSGMTYSIYSFVGNGPMEAFGYGQIIGELKPYMQAVMDTGIRFSHLRGVLVPVDERASYNKTIKDGFHDLEPNDFATAGYLSAMGVTYAFTTEKAFKNQTVAFFGDNMDNFTDDELKAVFADNFVWLDGSAVLRLSDRGLLHLISAKEGVKTFRHHNNAHVYEQLETGEKLLGIEKFRSAVGSDFVKIEYTEPVEVITRVYDNYLQVFGDCFVRGKNFAVLPFVIDKRADFWWSYLFAEIRRFSLTSTLLSLENPVIVSEMSGVAPYLYETGKDWVLILVNNTLENFPKIKLSVKGVSFKKIFEVTKNGKRRKVSFTRCGDDVILKAPLGYMETATFIFE